MLHNYIISAIRHIKNNKGFVLINILGLSIGMAVCLLIMQYVSYENNYDRFHDDYENIYRVQYNIYKNGELKVECAAAVPAVGPAMKDNFPEVIDFCRAFPIKGIVSYNDISFREGKMQVADPSFIQLLTFPLINGDPKTCLERKNTCLITDEAAKMYFGNDDPIGKTLKILNRDFEITGVLADIPENSHIKFSIIISYATIKEWWGDDTETAWGWYDFNTYVKLQPGTDHKEFNIKFNNWLESEMKEEWERRGGKSEFLLQPIKSIHLHSDLLQESEPDENGNATSVRFLSLIALFILVIAWLNYINLSTARSIERSKEIALRKVIGASRSQLVNQLMVESVILNLISLIFAFMLVELLLPYYRNFTSMPLNLDLLINLNIWIYLSVFFVVGTLISGLYPAVIISSFPPAAVIKGSFHRKGSDVNIRSILVIFQFIISFTLIAGIIIVNQQLNYMQSQDIGFDIDDTYVVKAPGVYESDSLYNVQFNAFKDEVYNLPFIESFTTSTNLPGDEIFWANGSRSLLQPGEKNTVMYIVGIDDNYIPAFGLNLIAGRNFSNEIAADDSAVIINKAAVKRYDFASPQDALEKQIILGRRTLTIAGVIDNFNQMSLKTNITPLAFPYFEHCDRYFSFKFNATDYESYSPHIKKLWDRFFPGNPYDYFFLDEFYNRQYKKDIQFSSVFAIFTYIAIFIALLGLMALSVFDNIKRNKEIAVRKANGATSMNIVLMLIKKMIKKIIIAIIIAIPFTWYLMDKWLNGYAYHIKIAPWVFVISALITVVVALAVILIHSLKTAHRNPAEILKYE